MVAHWRRSDARHRRRSLVMNAVGATLTSITIGIVLVTKFIEGAWITLLVIGGFMGLLVARRHREHRLQRILGKDHASSAPLALDHSPPPIIVVPVNRLDRVARKALTLALKMSPDVEAVQVLTDDPDRTDLTPVWHELVTEPACRDGLRAPKLTTIASQYRDLFGPLLAHIRELAAQHPDRYLAIVVPELVVRRWYHRVFRTRPMVLMALLRYRGGPRVVIIDAPWQLEE
jgi:hypothetical protein